MDCYVRMPAHARWRCGYVWVRQDLARTTLEVGSMHRVMDDAKLLPSRSFHLPASPIRRESCRSRREDLLVLVQVRSHRDRTSLKLTCTQSLVGESGCRGCRFRNSSRRHRAAGRGGRDNREVWPICCHFVSCKLPQSYGRCPACRPVFHQRELDQGWPVEQLDA
jgi:hypothetical protein